MTLELGYERIWRWHWLKCSYMVRDAAYNDSHLARVLNGAPFIVRISRSNSNTHTTLEQEGIRAPFVA